MSEFEDMLNSVLNNPEQMDKIMGLAQSLMGNDAAEKPAAAAVPDIAMLNRIGDLVSQSNDGKQALFEAMKPYLSEKRRGKMDKAMKLARIARIAQLAMGEMGGGNV